MEKKVYDTYVQILRNELKVALGCTEPIAIAYAGAKVREVLGQMPEHLEVGCSGNIVKNVKAVTVPNSGGQRGIQAAAAMGVIGGDASQELAVLEAVKPADIEKCKALLKTDFVDCNLVENVANLYIDIKATAGEHSAEVEIQDYHSNITKIVKDDQVLLNRDNAAGKEAAPVGPDKSLLNVKDILEFADTVDLKEVQDVLERQIEYNTAISEEGLKHPYGAEIGRTLMEDFDTSKVEVQAKALAAAGSERLPHAGGNQLRQRQPGDYGDHAGGGVCQILPYSPRETVPGADCQQPDFYSPETVYRQPVRLLRGYQCGLRQRGRHCVHDGHELRGNQ